MVLGQHCDVMSAYEFAVRNGLLPRLRNHGIEAYIVGEKRIHDDPDFLKSALMAGLVEHARRDNVVLLHAVCPSDKGIKLTKPQLAFISKWEGKEIGCNPNEHNEWTYLRRRAWIVEVPVTDVVNFEGDAKSLFEIGWKLKRERFTEFLLFSKAGIDNVITTLEMARGAKSAFDAIRTLQNNMDARKDHGIRNLPVDLAQFVLESRETEFEMGLVAWLAFTGAEALLKAHIIQLRGALAVLTEKDRKRAEVARNASDQVQDFLPLHHLGLRELTRCHTHLLRSIARSARFAGRR